MKLLGEEIDTQIAVLARLSGSRDADDLAWTTLQDQEVADTDVVAGDSDGVRPSTALNITDALANTFTDAAWPAIFLVDDYLLTLGAMAMGVEGVENTVGGSLEAMAQGVVAAFVVVVAHLGGWVNGGFGFDFYFLFFARMGASTLVFDVVGWLDASAVVTLGDVDFFFAARSFNVDLGLGEALVAGLTIAKRGGVA